MDDFNPYNWIWLGPIIGWVVYELWSFVTRLPGYKGTRLPTLSQLVWWGWDRFKYLPHVVASVFAVLFWHFFIARKRKPVDKNGRPAESQTPNAE